MRRLAFAAISLVLMAALFWAGLPALETAHPEDCDNMLGECLSVRQSYALDATWVVSIVAAGVCLWLAVSALLKPVRLLWSILLVAAFALLVGVIVVDPVGHLDNRYSGWFGDP